MSPSPQKKKQKSSGKKIAADFLSRTVNQVSTHICGTPTTQKAALSVLEDLAKSDNNISKMIVSSKAANGTPSYGILQEVSSLFFSEQEGHDELVKFSIIFINELVKFSIIFI